MTRHRYQSKPQGVPSRILIFMLLALFAFTTPAGAKRGMGNATPDKDTGGTQG